MGSNSAKISKLSASVMMYAVFVSVIILILISSLFLYSYINRITITSYHIKERLRQNSSSGINLLLADTGFQYNTNYFLDFYDSGIDSVHLHKSKWGIYDLLSVRSWYQGYQNQKKALAGGFYKRAGLKAIYLADQGSPLCVCGNTSIQGDCMLPVAGIKRGYVEGRHFTGSTLLQGEVDFSGAMVPDPGIDQVESIIRQFDIELDQERYEVMSLDDIESDSVYRSFFEKTLIIYDSDRLSVNQIALAGNIMLISKGDILIGPQSQLEDIICFARNIYVLVGTRANLQCIAKDTIWIGENCNLSYPSALSLFPDTASESSKLIQISEGSVIEGAIADYVTSSDPEVDLTAIKLEKNSHVTGQLFTGNSVILKGNVSGQVITGKFQLPTPSSLYINHLLDVNIRISELPEDFVGCGFLENSRRPKKIIRWLH
ncbi:MAG: hypothetical protein K9J24_10095 [Bacteroidales bacterium]|nr:hypothetical protein [Bacteroidales bacterium]